VLGVPLGELPPGAVPAVDLWGPAAARLEDDLHHARDVDGRHDVLERHVASCLSSRTVDPAVVTAARLLGRSGTSVARAAGEVGLSPRELRRRFVADVGYGPKTLHRILRFQAAVRTMTSGEVALADLAARHGYADQSHLGRETRRLSGSSPARLVALRSRIAG
jgi:AraC-like DNA-binding protein